jgi:hypothetical protein
VHVLGAQIVNAHRVLIQTVFKLSPTAIVTQLPQDNVKAIIGKIEAIDILIRHRFKSPEPIGHPGVDMHEAMTPRDKMELSQVGLIQPGLSPRQ